MNQFYTADQINYGALLEFLEEADITYSQPRSDTERVKFAFRFNVKHQQTIIELIQYGKYCRTIIFPVVLDGDPMVIDSFIRCFNTAVTTYTPHSDITKMLKNIPIERISFEYIRIKEDVFLFRDRIYSLSRELEKLYNGKLEYFQQLETRYMNGCYDPCVLGYLP